MHVRSRCRWYQIAVAALVIVLSGSVMACGSAPPTPVEQEAPSNAIAWHEAKNHVGERATICGPVIDTHYASTSKGKPTFLNIGQDYPSANRFTVVIWDDYRGNFPQAPDVYYIGKTICVTGLIIEYERIPEIEVKSPSQIQEQ